MVERFLAGDRRALARAITWAENHLPEAESLLQQVFARTGRARSIGITGPPGAGKSTLVDRLATHLSAGGQKVAVVAVDPSSPFSGGAILGDRIRMQQSLADPQLFMRSLASRGHLGGLSEAVPRVIDLLDAFGFDTILVETVGAGQSEIEVMRLVQTTVVVLVPGLGDDIQAIKAGILEIGDVFVVNKADREGADRTATEIEMMLDLAHMGEAGANRWDPAVRHPAVGAAQLERLDRTGHHAGAGGPEGVVVGAADGVGAGRNEPSPTAADLCRYGSEAPGGVSWRPPVVKAVARDGTGIDDLVSWLEQHRTFLVESGVGGLRRQREALAQVTTLVRERILDRVTRQLAGELAAWSERVADRQTDPYSAAAAVLRQALPPDPGVGGGTGQRDGAG